MIVVVGTYRNFKSWGAARPTKVGKWLPKYKMFENAVNVSNEYSAIEVLALDNLIELVVLNKNRNVNLDLLRRKVSIDKLLNR